MIKTKLVLGLAALASLAGMSTTASAQDWHHRYWHHHHAHYWHHHRYWHHHYR